MEIPNDAPKVPTAWVSVVLCGAMGVVDTVGTAFLGWLTSTPLDLWLTNPD